ncbi:MAG: hypothetical protein NTZ05_09825, partial [Chloroflexi bacterium]|nr:hypothetical protein [Chloroflexota bacterium]
TLIQVSVAPEFRGRVLSTMFLNRAAVPLGTVMAGFGAGVIGAPLTIGSMAAVLVALALLTRSIRFQAVAALPQHGARGPAPHPSPLPNSGGRAQDERGQASGIMDTPVLGLSPLAPSIGGKGPGARGPVPAPHSTRSQS